MKNVLLIINIPTPYRIPLFNELDLLMVPRGLKLKVVFASLGYARRKWDIDMSDCKFDYEVLQSRILWRSHTENITFFYSGITRIIKKDNPVVIITAGFSPATAKLWMLGFFRRIPYIIWSGAITDPGHKHSWLRKMYRRLLIKRAAGYIAYGTSAKDHLAELGAIRDQVHIGINTVDTEYYRENTKRARISGGKYDEVFRLLYVGQLSRRKNVGALIPVVHALAKQGRNVELDIIGDGEERAELEMEVARMGLESRITFYGFKQKREIPAFFARTDCFLFQTSFDIWGLVLVEAMSAGLVCLSSTNAGATHDLIIEGETGMTVDFTDVPAVVKSMCWMIDNPEAVSSMGHAARKFIEERVNLNVSAKGFLEAVESCL